MMLRSIDLADAVRHDHGGISRLMDEATPRSHAPAVTARLEHHDLQGCILTVDGWAFRQGCPLDEVAVAFEAEGYADRVVALSALAWPDLVERYGSVAARSGFRATGLLVLAPGALFLDTLGQDGRRRRVPLGVITASPSTGVPTFVPAEIGGMRVRTAEGFRAGLRFADLPAGRRVTQGLRPFGPTPEPVPSRWPVSILAILPTDGPAVSALLADLRERTTGHDEIVLVEEAPREPAASRRVRAEAARVPRCHVVPLAREGGPTAPLRAGFAARQFRGHVVVLRGGVALPPGWLPRLLWPLDALPDIASATPLSDAGAGAAFPAIDVANPAFLGLDAATIDDAFRLIDPRRLVASVPAWSGACTALHAEAIAAAGWADGPPPWSARAVADEWDARVAGVGLRSLLVPNLFVGRRARVDEESTPMSPCHIRAAGDPMAATRAIVAFRLARQAAGGPVRVMTLSPDDPVSPVIAALACPAPLIVLAFGEDRQTWFALLSAGGHREQVWGWGPLEAMALCAATGAPSPAPDARAFPA